MNDTEPTLDQLKADNRNWIVLRASPGTSAPFQTVGVYRADDAETAITEAAREVIRLGQPIKEREFVAFRFMSGYGMKAVPRLEIEVDGTTVRA